MLKMTSIEKIWHQYLETQSRVNTPKKGYTSWSFGDSEGLANELLALVLLGKKRASAGSLWVYEHEGEIIPKKGDFSVITNWAGDAKCIIKTKKVTILPFDEITEHFAILEGEGDLSLKFWQDAHWHFFERELAQYDQKPSWKMPIVCEVFECVYPLGLNTP